MKYIFSFLLSLLFLASCRKEVPSPEPLLKRSQMKAILLDLYLYKETRIFNDINPRDINLAQINSEVLKKHKISLEDFQKNYHYYVITHGAYDEILTEIQDSLKNEIQEEKLDMKEKSIPSLQTNQ